MQADISVAKKKRERKPETLKSGHGHMEPE